MFRVPGSETNALPLITRDDSGSFSANKKTVEWLRGLEAPLCPVSIAGKARTGKSFLFNRIVDESAGNGFDVGSTTNACTIGLWVARKTLPLSGGGTIVFIDTEGIDHANSNAEADIKIFALSLLLSSQVVFNSVGAIDESAVATLALATEVCDRVKQHGNVNVAFPRLVWVLRDFSLKMQSIDGTRTLTAAEYLEQTLAASLDSATDDVDGKSAQIASTARSAAPRKAINLHFVERTCFAFERPANDDYLGKLERRPSAMRKSFAKEVKALRQYLVSHARPLTSPSGKAIDPVEFGALCEVLAASVSAQKCEPNLYEIWTKVGALKCDVQAMNAEQAMRARDATPYTILQILCSSTQQACDGALADADAAKLCLRLSEAAQKAVGDSTETPQLQGERIANAIDKATRSLGEPSSLESAIAVCKTAWQDCGVLPDLQAALAPIFDALAGRANKEAAEARSKVQTCAEDTKSMQKLLDATDEKLADINARYLSIEQENSELLTRLQEGDAHALSSNANVEAAAQSDRLMEELAVARAERDSAQTRLASQADLIKDLERACARERSDKRAQKQRLAELEQQSKRLLQLQELRDGVASDFSQVQQTVAALQECLSSTAKQTVEAVKQMQTRADEVMQMRVASARCEAQSGVLLDSNKRLRVTVDEALAENKRLKVDLATHKAMMQCAQNTASESRQAYAALLNSVVDRS